MRRSAGSNEPTVEEIAAAIFRREFTPTYEPVVQLTTGATVGWEVHGNWIHPTRGVLTSAAYERRAEHAGLLDPVDDIVLDRALRRLRRWCGWNLGPTDPWVAITVPGSRLAYGAIVDSLRPLLAEYSIPTSHVTLGISKLSAFARWPDVIDTLVYWHDLGGSVAIEAAALLDPRLVLPTGAIDVVMLDVERVARVTDGDPCESELAAVIQRAAQDGIRVIAEGVETDAQRRMLADLGCDSARGPLLGRPGPDLQPASRALVA